MNDYIVIVRYKSADSSFLIYSFLVTDSKKYMKKSTN
jgi:hypothetical protein